MANLAMNDAHSLATMLNGPNVYDLSQEQILKRSEPSSLSRSAAPSGSSEPKVLALQTQQVGSWLPSTSVPYD